MKALREVSPQSFSWWLAARYNACSLLCCVGEHKESAVNHINLDAQGEAVKQFFLSLPVDPEGAVVELNGHPVARLLPIPARGKGDRDEARTWTSQKNATRCALIDKEIDSTLTPDEAEELEMLQRQMLRHRRQVAPLPLEDARRLHQELLAKAEAAQRT
jgi:antitoxin (DNA-binding transcriptional repressor) of toxin-antitoxin stability system